MRNSDRDERKEALASALRLLARRDFSGAELTARLQARGVAAPYAEETVARLREKGLLDDRRFARQFAESAIRQGRGYGVRLRLDLTRRGVAAEIIDEVLASLAVEYDEMETLSALLAKKFAGFNAASAPDREKRRVLQYFQRRGFSAAVIFQAFRIETD